MGSCVLKQKRSLAPTIVLTAPEFIYVDRQKKEMLVVKALNRSRAPINCPVYPDSLVGYSEKNSIYVFCGTKPNGKVSKKCSEIDGKLFSSTSLGKLPKAIKRGEIFAMDSCIILVNTMFLCVFRYDFSIMTWQELKIDMANTNARNLRDFSCSLHNGTLYIIAGKYADSDFSNDIFNLDTNSKPMKLIKSPLKFPGKLTRARSLFSSNFFIVVGGQTASQTPSNTFYSYSVSDPYWQTTCSSEIQFESNYCVILHNKAPAFIAFPTIVSYFNGLFVFFNISLPTSDYQSDSAELAVKDSEESSPENSFDKKSLRISSRSSSYSGSYVLQARVLTPVNGMFHDTISSIDSDLSSQHLPSDPDQQILYHEEINSTDIPAKPLTINAIRNLDNICVYFEYSIAKEFINFIANALSVDNLHNLPKTKKSFTLFEFEKILRMFKFQLYPVETFKMIIKALDILFGSNGLNREEREAFNECAGVEAASQFIRKERFISSVIFRIKLILLRKAQ